MPKELPFDETSYSHQWAEPTGDGGLVIRTRYKDTDRVLDTNARFRAEGPQTFREKGRTFYKVGSIPMEVYEQLTLKLGRQPTAQECLELIQSRDYSKLKTVDANLA